ncbi:MAG: carbohydrate kinase family protein [Gammaproteobacteria bacterium]
MTALICGSFAYDNIMVFQDHFKNHILPEKVHILNVSFMVPELRREFGGCAGNIAYNLNLLDSNAAIPMGTVGKDFDPYACWMDKNKVNRKHVAVIDDMYTAQAFITTDLGDNQITAFHPGAMEVAHKNKLPDIDSISIGMVSPDGRDGMLQHAAQFVETGIPFIFDPGQGIPMFDGSDLINFIDQATWVTVNDYEWQLMQERTGLAPHDITERVEALIVTRGGDGSLVYTRDKRYEIPSVKSEAVLDPTGCGDAYRAGLLYGLLNGMDWETTGRIASLMGAIKIESHGTQNHSFTLDEFKTRFKEYFGDSF